MRHVVEKSKSERRRRTIISPVGGANAPIRALPTANKTLEEEEKQAEEVFSVVMAVCWLWVPLAKAIRTFKTDSADMSLKDVTKWNKIMSMVYAGGVFGMIGSYGFFRYMGRYDDQPGELHS